MLLKTKLTLAKWGVAIAALFAMIITIFSRGKRAGKMEEIQKVANEKLKVIKVKQAALFQVKKDIKEKHREVNKQIEEAAKDKDPVRARVVMGDVALNLNRIVRQSRAGKFQERFTIISGEHELSHPDLPQSNERPGNPTPAGKKRRKRRS
jgi:hypothetical protein